MSERSATADDWIGRLATAGDRLVDPSVTAPARARHVRLLAAMLGSAFLVATGLAQTAFPVLGPALTLAAICVTAVAGLSLVLALVISRRERPVGCLALLAAVPSFAALVHLGGGLSSPLALLLAAPAVEAWLAARSRGALWAGLAASGLAVVAVGLAAHGGLPTGLVGPWLWLLPAAWVTSVVARRDAFAAQPQAEAAGEDLVHAAALGVVPLRIASGGDVASISGECRSLLGLAPGFLEGQGLFERLHVADRVSYLSAVADAIASGKAEAAVLRLRLPAVGAEAALHRRFRLDLLGGAPGGPVSALLADVEETEALRDVVAEARRQSEMSDIAKRRFLATVSHELRTPLNAISGFSDMMLQRMCGELAPRQAEYVGLIKEAGDHLLAVVNAILDVSKIEAGAYAIKPEPFVAAEAVETVVAMMTPQAAARGVSLDCRELDRALSLTADRRAVQQMLINLVSNAVKFTPAGGSIAVRVERDPRNVVFVVSDTGIGIAAGDLDRLGEPFSQVDNDYARRAEGTGLGLSLVRGLVELHQGAMAIESAPGQGTAVTIRLPVRGPKQAGSGRGEIVAMPSQRRNQETSHEEFRKSA